MKKTFNSLPLASGHTLHLSRSAAYSLRSPSPPLPLALSLSLSFSLGMLEHAFKCLKVPHTNFEIVFVQFANQTTQPLGAFQGAVGIEPSSRAERGAAGYRDGRRGI